MLVAKDELHVYVGNSIFCIKLIQPGANLCFSVLGLGLWCLTPLSTIFQLYRGCQFHWWRKLFRAPGENHRPAASHWQTLSYKFVSSTPRLRKFELTTLVVIDTDCIGSCKSNIAYALQFLQNARAPTTLSLNPYLIIQRVQIIYTCIYTKKKVKHPLIY